MARISQLGIAIGALGAMVMLMGLFPGITGVQPTSGVGVLQLFTVLFGFTLLIIGALIYVKFAYYISQPATLTQQIGTRLALTGIMLAALAGLADALGFGSHGAEFTEQNFLGPWQAGGIIGSYIMSCLGVLIYALGGDPDPAHFSRRDDDEDDDE